MEIIFETKVKGMLFKDIYSVIKEYEYEFKKGLMESTLLLQRETVLKTPVNMGILRKSILSEVRGEGLNMQGVVGSNLGYALPVEMGTIPFFPPSAPIELWVKRVGLTAVYKSVELTTKQIAFLVCRKISERGLSGKFMFRDALNSTTARILAILEEAQNRLIKKIK